MIKIDIWLNYRVQYMDIWMQLNGKQDALFVAIFKAFIFAENSLVSSCWVKSQATDSLQKEYKGIYKNINLMM